MTVTIDYAEAPDQIKKGLDWARKSILNDLHEAEIECWVAGGALRALFASGERIKDVDLFFPNAAEAEKADEWFKEGGAKQLAKFETATKWLYKRRVFDVVKVFASEEDQTPETTIGRFDFTVACVAATRDKLCYHDTFWIDLAAKALVINAPTMPVATLRRLQKFVQRGYKFCNGGVVSLAQAINEMDAEEITLDGTTLYLD